jgi:hypothetical protein
MLVSPTIRRLETIMLNDTQQVDTLFKRRRLFFHEAERSKGKVNIINIVNVVGSPAVFADLTLVLQSIITKPYIDISIVEIAMSSYTTLVADSLGSKIRKIYAYMIL